jgi:hypothetical protein
MLTLFVLSTGVGAVDQTQVILKTWVLVVRAGEESWRVERREERNADTSCELETSAHCMCAVTEKRRGGWAELGYRSHVIHRHAWLVKRKRRAKMCRPAHARSTLV